MLDFGKVAVVRRGDGGLLDPDSHPILSHWLARRNIAPVRIQEWSGSLCVLRLGGLVCVYDLSPFAVLVVKTNARLWSVNSEDLRGMPHLSPGVRDAVRSGLVMGRVDRMERIKNERK